VNASLAAMPTATSAPTADWRDGWRSGLSYGALGLPLAFVALPMYVVLPNHYAETFGVPLALLGALLLAARLLDAFVDPWIGRQCDRWFAHSTQRVLAISVAAALALAVGFVALFFPPLRDLPGLLAWCGLTLALCYLSYSVLSIVHQSWGARLGGDAPQRARIVSWREGLSLVGVLLASLLSSTLGPAATSAVLAVSLVLALAALWQAPRAPARQHSAADSPMRLALANPSFRRLLGVYLVNGIASAIPATLVLFFIRDRLQAVAYEPLFLGSYFLAAALSMPLWMRAVSRFGLARSWLAGMLLAIVSFVWAAGLGAGDVLGFAAVCVASGVALGADLALPGAMLVGVIRRAGHQGRSEGMYFGWWNLATKLNLALAAGISLPLLGLFGYAPGSRDATALAALTLAYCALPCVLKLFAAALLYWRWMRSPEGSTE
jgi:glycoside/pentoside/hexuronide:cation symporter, GPH family